MSWPRYPEYKDSGVEWLGEVPAHWLLRPLKHLVVFSSGGTPSKENLDYWNGDIPWASAKDLKVEILLDTEDHVTEHAVSSGAASILPIGSVLVVVRGMILARTFPVTRIAVPMAINQDLKGLQATGSLNGDFLAWLLRGSASESLRRLDEAGHGTKALRMDAWSSMLLPIPSMGEQTAIAGFLDRETAKIDALVAEQDKLLTLLAEKRQATISRAVTQGLDPDVPMKDSGVEWLGEVPAHWEMRRGRFLYSQADDPPEVGDGVVTAFRDGQVTLRENRRTDGFTQAILEVGYQHVKRGDLVIHGMDAFAGAIGVSESDGKCTPEYSVLRGMQPGILNSYFAAVLRVMAKRNFIYVLCPSVRERAPRFRYESFKDVLLPLPPVEEQVEIVRQVADELSRIDALTAEASRAIALLKERRTALISAAVTGKIDVRNTLLLQETCHA